MGTTRKKLTGGARFWDSVAHPWPYWMRHRIHATKLYFYGAYVHAPQNSHIFVAHPHDMQHKILKKIKKDSKIQKNIKNQKKS